MNAEARRVVPAGSSLLVSIAVLRLGGDSWSRRQFLSGEAAPGGWWWWW
ncbi:MAG TPA: hypothetical protein VKI64_07665 [Acidimicrobiales bacterium]|nr:hypothetical protein [Acidimicrobiales bacterium]